MTDGKPILQFRQADCGKQLAIPSAGPLREGIADAATFSIRKMAARHFLGSAMSRAPPSSSRPLERIAVPRRRDSGFPDKT
jgi:hypothetical protein